MDITWVSIGKVLVAGLSTYVLLPAVLIFRDYLLWKLIDACILNDKLRQEVRNYARLADKWNKEYAGKRSFEPDDQEFRVYMISSQELSDRIKKSKLFIDRKSEFLSWLLKHYKQDGINPINEWKTQAKAEIDCFEQENN